MSKAKDKKNTAIEPKLDQNEGIQLENLNLAVEREEIYTRMDMLNKECKKLKDKYLKLESQYENLNHELQQERARGL